MMRLLHTADWHLGRSFHGESLLDAHAAVIDHLVDLARDQHAEAVVVAGDVYDRALPPVEAVRLADEALARLSEICPVVVISGNHDSVERLGFGARILDRAGVHVRTRAETCGTPVIVGDTCIYPLPYLEPDVTRATFGPPRPERSHAAVLRAAMDRVRADLRARPPGTRSVVVAHAFVTGGQPSDSERDLSVSGAATVPASVFAGIDYLALGHLHGPQKVGTHGRYAGSPVPLSFSEARHVKSTAVLELMLGTATYELVPTPVPRPLASIRGALDTLLADPGLADHESSWVQATLTDPVQPRDAMARLRARFPHAVALAFEPEGVRPGTGGTYAARLHGLDDAALVERFVEDVRGTELHEDERELLDAAHVAGRTAQVAA